MAFDVEISGNDRIITPTGEGSEREAVDAIRAYLYMSNIGGEINGWECIPMFDGWQVTAPVGETFRYKPVSPGQPQVQRISGASYSRMGFAVGGRSRRSMLRS